MSGGVHGSFTLTVELDAPAGQVYAAFEDRDRRSRWQRLPGRQGDAVREDFRTGTVETLTGVLPIGDRDEHVRRTTHVLLLEPGDERSRLVLACTAWVDDACRWASLATVEIAATGDRTCRLAWTEQYAFLQLTGTGEDDVPHLVGGTRLQLTGLAVALGLTPRPAVLS